MCKIFLILVLTWQCCLATELFYFHMNHIMLSFFTCLEALLMFKTKKKKKNLVFICTGCPRWHRKRGRSISINVIPFPILFGECYNCTSNTSANDFWIHMLMNGWWNVNWCALGNSKNLCDKIVWHLKLSFKTWYRRLDTVCSED